MKLNQLSLASGLLCPLCGGKTTTYRHPHAKVWCTLCGFVLKEEGDQTPYDYKKHLIAKHKDKNSEKLKNEACDILNSLLKIPEEYSNGSVERLIDCIINASILQSKQPNNQEELYTKDQCQKIYEQGFMDCYSMSTKDAKNIVFGVDSFPVFPNLKE